MTQVEHQLRSCFSCDSSNACTCMAVNLLYNHDLFVSFLCQIQTLANPVGRSQVPTKLDLKRYYVSVRAKVSSRVYM